MSLLSRWRAAHPEPTLDAHALPPGVRLGGVRIGSRLAAGTQGQVYAATDEASGAPRVLKAWADEDPGAAGEAGRRHFVEHGERLTRLIHPGIVRIHGGGVARGVAFVVMDRAAGHPLARYARPGRLLPEPVVLEIAARLAEALACAHRHGVVHRDIKPDNAFFDPASGDVGLADFGLARSESADATRSGLFLGSPAYMAPELLAGAVPDAASDLYALGVLVYELLAGCPPFEGASLGDLMRSVADAPPLPLATRRPELDAPRTTALDALLAPLLAKSPAARCRDGDAWAADARAARARWGAPT
ncbi:MAG TPA: serine/threonine-protein kinase [Burkholderiaceae bacterium]|nr:serine/threonine-protein kinase [Burkholderiaceae bacterium]